MARLIVVIVVLAEWSIVAPANGESAVSEGDSATVAPKVIVRCVHPEEAVRVGGPIELVVELDRGKPPVSMEVRNIELRIPRDLAIDDEQGKELGVMQLPHPDRNLDDLSARLVPLAYRTLDDHRWAFDWGLWSFLTYKPQNETIVASVTYKGLGPDDQDLTIESELDFPVQAHPLGMYAGAVVGVLFGALFVPLVGMGQVLEQPVFSWAGWLKALPRATGRVVVRLVRALVATAIVILLLHGAANADFGVSVKVEDFYGGVLLGLSSETIVLAVYRYLTRQ